MFKAILCVLAGIAMLVYEFPILRGQRRTQPLTPDQKIWRILVLITVLLLLALGGRFFSQALKTKSPVTTPANHL